MFGNIFNNSKDGSPGLGVFNRHEGAHEPHAFGNAGIIGIAQ